LLFSGIRVTTYTVPCRWG